MGGTEKVTFEVIIHKPEVDSNINQKAKGDTK